MNNVSELDKDLNKVEDRAREMAQQASGVIRFLARVGYTAYGLTYLMAGTLALLAAFSFAAGRIAGSADTLASLLDHPFGWIALCAIAAGLACYALWCFVQAIADPEHFGHDWQGLRRRFATLCRGFVNLGLVAIAIGAMIGVVHSDTNRDAIEDWTGRVMSLPLGIIVVAAIGVGVVIFGGFQLFLAFRPERFDRQFNFSSVPSGWRKALSSLGRVGVAARGCIFLVVGAFLILAAYHANPKEARGVGRALRFVQHQPEGQWLLALIALGLISYGLFQFALARYRRIDPS